MRLPGVLIPLLVTAGLSCSSPSGPVAPSSVGAVTYRAVSWGYRALQTGRAQFFVDGTLIYSRQGRNGARGFNVAAMVPGTDRLIAPITTFDPHTGIFRPPESREMAALVDFLEALPSGALILLAVVDEAGLSTPGCRHKTDHDTQRALQALEALGSRQIRRYCYRDSWAMIAIKGEGAALDEALSQSGPASAEAMCTGGACVRASTAARIGPRAPPPALGPPRRLLLPQHRRHADRHGGSSGSVHDRRSHW